MKEAELRDQIAQVKSGRLDRRSFISQMIALGLTAPMASQMLLHSGVAMAQSKFEYKPTKRGGGGTLKLLWWQGPTVLNPHFAQGTKDQDGCRLFYEPLAAWDEEGNLVPVLAAEIPTRENGGLSADGKSITWKIKKNVKWHDGKPMTADDIVFTWEYARDPATTAVTVATYKNIEVEKIDDYSVRVKLPKAQPFWAESFVGVRGMIMPKHVFGEYIGGKSRDAPANTKPVGTGPYKMTDFRPGDLITGVINNDYHTANMPFFDAIEMKGGGDAVSAARAVLQTGEYDFAWNMQVEEEILSRLENGGKGKAIAPLGANIEHFTLNPTDPNMEVDGERSSLKTKHPVFADPKVREAFRLLIDRKAVQDHIYGRAGLATANMLNGPDRFRSKNVSWEFNVEKAIKLLDEAGWKPGAGGIREKDGKRMKFVFQTSTNAPRQKTQAIIKQACQKAGIDLELKSVVASVFFSADPGNNDTFSKFYCDIQMYTNGPQEPDPALFMNTFRSSEIATKDNKWQGRNPSRWSNADYDKLSAAAESELDPVKRAAMFIEMNDILVKDGYVIPIVWRPLVAAVSNSIRCRLSGWDVNTGSIESWYKV